MAGVLIQSQKSVNYSVAKHYRIAQAFIRQLVANGVVQGCDVKSGDNLLTLVQSLCLRSKVRKQTGYDEKTN